MMSFMQKFFQIKSDKSTVDRAAENNSLEDENDGLPLNGEKVKNKFVTAAGFVLFAVVAAMTVHQFFGTSTVKKLEEKAVKPIASQLPTYDNGTSGKGATAVAANSVPSPVSGNSSYAPIAVTPGANGGVPPFGSPIGLQVGKPMAPLPVKPLPDWTDRKMDGSVMAVEG
ncbi:MAG: hypothetical protein H7240_08260, partial [Glaciimonas sp.]|nr:hypothetical protein [Glaciimonas sp.]